MWQPETFDAATINRELGWAAEIGMNTIRAYLHDLLFKSETDAFLDRMDQFVATAQSHGIGVLPVLFDGVWHPEPRLGYSPNPPLDYITRYGFKAQVPRSSTTALDGLI